MQQIKKMGPLKNIIEMLPGVPKQLKNAEIDDKELLKIEAIIHSMTKQERIDPSIINGSRIAKGSGTQVSQVNKLLKQFEETRKMMKQMTNMKLGGKKFKFPF